MAPKKRDVRAHVAYLMPLLFTDSMQDKTVAVVGLGYVGLPVALLAAEKGWHVIGIDTDQKKVAAINAGHSPLDDPTITEQVAKKPFTATTDLAAVSEAAVIVIAVPTPVTDDHEPDLGPLKGAITGLQPHLQPGQVLSVESTIHPGVMQEVVSPLLGDLADQLHIAHCPERINPGDQKWTVANIPRVIGGFTPEATEKAAAFYEDILDADVLKLGSVTEAEAVKILENTFRDINIAFINEMAKSFDVLGIDIMKVIAGASTKPFAFMPHYPGNGVGGHCIGVDPYYMIERARQVGFDHEFLRLARDINTSMPHYTVGLLEEGQTAAELPDDTPIALLGVAYKKNIDDVRESPALEIQELLEDAQTDLRIFDPHVPDRSTVADISAALASQPIVMLGCDHDELVAALTPDALVAAGVKLVIDGKNALDADGIAAVGIHYYGIGRRRQPDQRDQ